MATEFQFLEGEEDGTPATLRYVPPAVTRPPDPLGTGLAPPAPVVDLAPRRPAPPPPAQMRAYEPTTRERDAAAAQRQLEALGMDRAAARRTAQTVLGGPSSNFPLDIGIVDFPLLPAMPYFMEEGYRSTGRAAEAFKRGDYGTSALEYLGGAAQMLPGVAAGGMAARAAAPKVRAAGRAISESMAAQQIDSPMARSQRGIFGGVNAKTADLPALGRAEAAELEGKTAEQIWQDTGWFRGADGKWRFEIDDSAAAFKGIEAFSKYRDKQYAELSALTDAEEARRLLDEGIAADGVKSAFTEATGRDLSDEALNLAKKFKASTLAAKTKNASRVLSNVVQNVPMREVLEHPQLFAAYPQLANLPVSFASARALGEGVEAQYRQGTPGAIDILQEYGMLPYQRAGQGKPVTLHEGMHAIQQAEGFSPGASLREAEQALAAGQLPARMTPEQGYMGAAGEVEGRLVEARADLTAEERALFPPMSRESGGFGPDIPYEQQIMGQQGQPFPAQSLSTGMAGRQRGAVLFGMGGEPQRPLRDVLADQPTTLRTLENLPQRQGVIPLQTIREQLRRPEVTKQEKEVFDRVLGRTQGDSISAEDLVREVGLETKNFTLTPKDSFDLSHYADYGLANIDRYSDIVPWEGRASNAQNARTTIYRSPTPTATNNHFGDPNYFGHTRAFEADGIPHVVEIQSDLVQKAGKELTPEERARIQDNLKSVLRQEDVVYEVLDRFPSLGGDSVAWAKSAARDILNYKEDLLRANPDFIMMLEESIYSKLPGDELSAMGAAAFEEGGLLQYIASIQPRPGAGLPNIRHVGLSAALESSLKETRRNLGVLSAEYGSKLEAGGAEAQRPMFKNWERRLIREELTRAATPQYTKEYADLRNRAKEAIKYAKQIEEAYKDSGIDLNRMPAVVQARKDAEYFAQQMQQVEKYRPTPPVVRFADADTVALVEGWPRDLEYLPGETFDDTLKDRRLLGVHAGTANDWKYTGNVRMDDRGIWEAERYPVDVNNNKTGEPIWSHSGTSNISERVLNKMTKVSDKFQYPEHQGIYDRYNKEVTNYLKSLGGKQVKDDKGHSWWEVPVKPQQRRTQIFGMGGGAVAAGGAATYNAEQD